MVVILIIVADVLVLFYFSCYVKVLFCWFQSTKEKQHEQQEFNRQHGKANKEEGMRRRRKIKTRNKDKKDKRGAVAGPKPSPR